ncbi:MAG TPA: Ppx/GppA phosphatase family protein [Solirubrobacteraceae bacterium]|nr:Ppx/GppA phosphatase family protein [Solirubrobacteraceae bacterium]
MSWRTTRAAARSGEPSRTVAVVDLGSNSWRLVVYTFVPGRWWKRTDELYEIVRIAAHVDERGRLSEPAIARGLETLGVFGRFCAAAGLAPGSVHAVATSAIREAPNRDAFLAGAARATDRFAVEVVPAREEARLGYVAAANTTTLRDGAVLEIGGGSLQLIEVRDRRAGALESFELGAVVLTERFLADGGPATGPALDTLRAHVRSHVVKLSWLHEAGRQLVGIGGAVRTLAAAAQRASGQPDIGIQGFTITREALSELVSELAALPAAARASVPGIKPARADIILAAAVTIETVLEAGGFDGLEVTEAGLREGLFIDRELLAGREPLLDDVRACAVCNLAVQYESDLPHAEHVATLSLELFDSLAAEGVFAPAGGERELLWAAAMLHDVGMTISYDDHHKHSRYLIVSAELPGFDPRERALIAQISRYHRKGMPKLGELSRLARDGDQALLERCSALVRVAEHLERGRDQAVREVSVSPGASGLRLRATGDLTLPRWSIERYGDSELFERAFGQPLVVG